MSKASAASAGNGDAGDAVAPVAEKGIGHLVASHYNNLEDKGVASRSDSRIYHMRNLNNWIKSMLINEYVSKIRREADAAATNGDGGRGPRPQIRVLDIGAGKGGDLLKWQKARADHVVCADIAETSVQQAKGRYQEMRDR
jgi:mRNA (guanine-N7-)-methyltransferase